MIVAEQKRLEEISSLISDAAKVLIVGCKECVTVCLAGGEREVEILASTLNLKGKADGNPIETVAHTLQRQCEPEYVKELERVLDREEGIDVILSLGCGVGVQFIAEHYPDYWVVPGLNTTFAGGALEEGKWAERCGLCGECVLHRTGGICPIIRCSKSILNGPCGGSQDGKCEVDDGVDCAWQLIYDRLKGLGRLELLTVLEPPKDWSKARHGGPRAVVREDVRL